MPERNELKTARHQGVDALRIVATMMVLILHVLNIGQINAQIPAYTPAYWLCAALFIGCHCAVNCYGLISGYVGLYSRCRYYKLALLWLQIVFYNLLGLAVMAVVSRQLPEAAGLLRAVTPLLHQSFWYFTAYFGMFFLIPVMNRGLQGMTRRQARALFWAIFTVFSGLSTLTGLDFFVTQFGYSVIWLILLYILGGCIRRGDILSRVPSQVLLAIYLLCVAAALLMKGLLREPVLIFQALYHSNTLVSYTSPTVLLCAVTLLVVFSRMGRPGRWNGKLVAVLAPCSFGIYILHMQDDLRTLLFELPLFGWIAKQGALVAPLIVLLTALVLYILCAAIEKLRQWLFKALHIQTALEKLETRFLGRLWSEE